MYDKVVKDPWPYWIGGILLALLNICLLIVTGSTWRVSGGFLYWGAWGLEKIGFTPANWYYFSVYQNGVEEGQTFLNNPNTVLNIAVIVGALIAALWASEFKWKKIKNVKQLCFALIGGIVMGYGTILSFGCNISAYFSAIPSFSLHGWVFAAFMFVGSWIGSKVLIRYIL
ncbi:YeeE/YedE thiosulfate transporter family protein [Alkaliphilus metalliredigens]|uniref:YeeE/YedE thiosulfate transporter family protein n=1 Tax=Alkaliphilus metalliredigens TaxID=208226 RepID=UPI0024171E01|nr:YeeE/YedE thiosulfate transporter family protein [Alkaliphilus metalliredigens]